METTDSPLEAPLRRVRWVGPTDGPQFAACYQLLAETAELVADDDRADLTVFACPRPTVDVSPIEAAAKLGESVQLLGVWCEGEGRTGHVVEGVERVFWHAWPAWWRAGNADHAAPRVTGPVWIRTTDSQLAASLIDGLAAESISATWAPTDRLLLGSPAAMLWDGSQLGGREAGRLAAVCDSARRTETPVVAMLDFPRPETVAAAEAIGAAAVVGKPLDREQLFETLGRVIAGSDKTIEARTNHSPTSAAVNPAMIARAA